jgi:RimJ/RimL family protein N-acetyltransferase
MPEHLKTERLLLRPFRPVDAEAVQTLCANWKVARMTTRIAHPYPEGAAALWIASHSEAGARDEEHTLCIERDGEPIGAVGLRKTADRVYEVGYWIGEPWWGRGYATEAAARLLRFAFRELGAARATSGHFLDNPASGRVLEKCGFAYTGEDREWSEARGEEVAVRRFELNRGTARKPDAAS